MGKNKTLGDRMKGYEACYSFIIPARTYTIVRVDGRGFSKFTKGMNKPFDDQFSESMNYAAIELCKKFNPAFAYTQSDEITMVFTDFGENQEAIFSGKVQKICSLTAARATASFNKKMLMMTATRMVEEIDFDIAEFGRDIEDGDLIYDVEFDSRVYVIPDIKEVANCLVWRQQDATRNSISMAADEIVGKSATKGKKGSEKQDMMFENGVNWNDYAVKYKRGVVIRKVEKEFTSDEYTFDGTRTDGKYTRKVWEVDNETPIFTQNWEHLYNLIPSNY